MYDFKKICSNRIALIPKGNIELEGHNYCPIVRGECITNSCVCFEKVKIYGEYGPFSQQSYICKQFDKRFRSRAKTKEEIDKMLDQLKK